MELKKLDKRCGDFCKFSLT